MGHSALEAFLDCGVLRPLLLGLALSCLFQQSVQAQPYLTHSHAIEEGLVQSQATAIHQDKDGYLWVGTQGGISRFDGLYFKNYTIDEGLLSNHIFALAEDSTGRLWAGTSQGINILDSDTLVALTTKEGLLDDHINDLLMTPDKSIWIASRSGLSRFDGTSFKHLTEADGLINKNVTSIAATQESHLWIGMNNGLCYYDTVSVSCYTVDQGLPAGSVNDILVDRNRRIWVATNTGIAQYAASTDRFITLAGVSIQSATALLEDNTGGIWTGNRGGLTRLDTNGTVTHKWRDGNWITQTLYEDREGNIWAGTSGSGILQFKQTAFSHMNPILGLQEDATLSLYEDSMERLWVGTKMAGIYMVDGANITQYNTNDNPLLNHVRSINEDQNGHYWFGSLGGVTHFDGQAYRNYTMADGLAGSYIYTVKPAKNGTVWIGSNGGLNQLRNGQISTIPLSPEQANQTVYTIYENNDGTHWIGSTLGLSIYDQNGITNIDALSNKSISSIQKNSEDNFWLGTLGHGVLLFDPQTEQIVDTLNVASGLNSNLVYFIQFDKQGDLWVGTSMGVNRVNMATYRIVGKKSIRSFNRQDGIVGMETNMNTSVLDQQGRLWFGTIDGLMQYDAATRPVNSIPPIVHLDDVRLFLESTDLTIYGGSKRQKLNKASLTLPHDQNHLTFDFKALSLTTPEQVHYQYRMHGFDADWSPESKSRSATYANLSPGTYSFEVRARNGDGVWSATSQIISFRVLAPFWQTSWFILLAIGSAILGIVGIIQIRTRGLEKKQQQLEAMVRARTQALEHTHQQLLEAREEALAAARAKSAFMSTMTHELRTPMNGILGMTQVLGTTDLDHEQLECMQSILNCSTEMVSLIENMLTFADLAAGKRNIQMKPFHLENLLQDSINTLSSQICAKDLEIRYFISPSLPERIEGDREHLRQILQHLLSNAVKFTESGIIYIEVLLHRPSPSTQPQQHQQLLISVQDTGIGMEQDELKRVFEPFSQADMSLTRRYSGVGIGLALAQQLTALLGGKLMAESWPGIGSTFSFTLPAPNLHQHTGQSSNDPLFTKRVLIATSSQQERRRLSLLCRSLGMRTGSIEPASDHAVLASTGADIIITDNLDYLVDAASYEVAIMWICEDNGMSLDHAYMLPCTPCREQIKEGMLEVFSGEKTE